MLLWAAVTFSSTLAMSLGPLPHISNCHSSNSTSNIFFISLLKCGMAASFQPEIWKVVKKINHKKSCHIQKSGSGYHCRGAIWYNCVIEELYQGGDKYHRPNKHHIFVAHCSLVTVCNLGCIIQPPSI